MSRATELADEADTLVRLHKSSGLGMDPDAAAGLLERQALELRRLDRVNAELVEASIELRRFYAYIWDRVDGAIFLMPESVGAFESAFEKFCAALTSATKETK